MTVNYALTAWSQEGMTVPERFLALAQANLKCSHRLFEEMDRGSLVADWPSCCAAAFLAEHGVELFLKGAILHARGPRAVGNTHALDQLFRAFEKLYPGKDFAFRSSIEDLVRRVPGVPFSEYSRYPVTRTGELMHYDRHFDPNLWRTQLKVVVDDVSSVESRILSRYPLVTLERVLWKAVEEAENVYEREGREFRLPRREIAPEPRTGLLRVGERGRLTIPRWLATETGLAGS